VPVVVENAIVLARYPFRERSAVAVFLTRGRGSIRALVRRSQGRGGLAAALEPLSQVTVTLFLSPRRELAVADEVALVRSWQSLAEKPLAWSAAQVAAELALELCPPGTVQEGFYRLLEKTPAWLAAGAEPVKAVLYVKLWSLKLAGVLPDPFACHLCNQPLVGKGAFFVAESGFVCSRHGVSGLALSKESLRFFHEALRLPLDQVQGQPDEAAKAVLERLCRQFLEKELKAQKVFWSLQEALRKPW
jgi:DNA repair protein RecO